MMEELTLKRRILRPSRGKTQRIAPTMLMITSLALPMATLAGEFSVAWEPPTEYVDGTPLYPEDISGYTVKYGTASGTYQYQAKIPGVVSSATISGISGGTYFVVVSVTSTAGVTSDNSNEVVKKVGMGKPKAPRL